MIGADEMSRAQRAVETAHPASLQPERQRKKSTRVQPLASTCPLTRGPAPPPAEHARQHLLHAAGAAAAALRAVLAEAVVARALVGVGQRLVRLGNLLELLGVPAPVGVLLAGEDEVGLADLRRRRVLLQAQHAVELGGVHLLLLAAAARAAVPVPVALIVVVVAGHAPGHAAAHAAEHEGHAARGEKHGGW